MTFSTAANFQNTLLRKGLVGAVFVADYTVAALTDITVPGPPVALAPLTGYNSLGKLDAAGVAIQSAQTETDIMGWGDLTSPARVDITGGTNGMTFSAMETKRAVWDAFYAQDLSAVTANANGTVTFDKPPVPVLRDKRVLFLARDVNKATGADIYIGVHFLRANISSNGDTTFANAANTVDYPLTVKALVDDVAGTAVRLFLGGPGVDATLKTAMGF